MEDLKFEETQNNVLLRNFQTFEDLKEDEETKVLNLFRSDRKLAGWYLDFTKDHNLENLYPELKDEVYKKLISKYCSLTSDIRRFLQKEKIDINEFNTEFGEDHNQEFFNTAMMPLVGFDLYFSEKYKVIEGELQKIKNKGLIDGDLSPEDMVFLEKELNNYARQLDHLKGNIEEYKEHYDEKVLPLVDQGKRDIALKRITQLEEIVNLQK